MVKEIGLTDLIDVDTLQKIQDAFSNATGMAALTVDLNGAVTKLSNPTDFCMNLTRGCPKGAQRCNQCDLQGGEQAGRTGRPAVYYCHGGLMDFAAPVFLGNKQIGSLIGGQVLPEPPDEEKFRKIAAEIGIDPDTYIRALAKIKIVPKKTIEASAELLYIMANALSDTGFQRYKTLDLAGELKQVSYDMNRKIRTATDRVTAIETQNDALIADMNHLFASTQQSKDEVEKTNEIVQYMSNISMQTKLLGFNASIEASRAREYGTAFNVIAQEIRKLAETSQSQFTKVDDILQNVKSTILTIDDKIELVNTTISNNTQLLKGISEVIAEINAYANKLEELGIRL